MAQNLVMRQLDERTTEQEVSLLLWSPKMDILAAGQIHRWLRRMSELLIALPSVPGAFLPPGSGAFIQK
jgi:hypothetical protein